MAKPVRLRRAAADDIDASLDYYLRDADADVAGRFVTAVERAVVSIAKTPRSGSLRFAYDLEIPNRRFAFQGGVSVASSAQLGLPA